MPQDDEPGADPAQGRVGHQGGFHLRVAAGPGLLQGAGERRLQIVEGEAGLAALRRDRGLAALAGRRAEHRLGETGLGLERPAQFLPD